jgi:peptide/nickel transport system ATP-binding protein/oligopeptide transport system ATP-binding protein
MDDILLDVKGLRTYFYTNLGVAKAVDGVDFWMRKGTILGIVGESGCGKSVTAMSILRLIPDPPGKIVSGEVIFNGTDLLTLSNKDMRKVRGNRISMIFQEPMTSLNPVLRVGEQISEAIRLHQRLSRKEAFEKAIEMLDMVKIPSPKNRIHEYPHQMSGGMRQRVMIAMALSCNPALMIADEPTTALDVTIQAQILYLMQNLKDEIRTAIMLITHDLSIIAENAQEVLVMYAGKVMEYAEVEDLFDNPSHPYTLGLQKSNPHPDDRRERLDTIPGIVPSLYDAPQGCKFNDRCNRTVLKCKSEEPPLLEVGTNHLCRCWLYE